MGSLVFVLLTPLSHWGWFLAYVGSSIIRGLAVGLGVFVVTIFFAMPGFVPRRCGSSCLPSSAPAMLGTLGLIAGLWAEKFDQMAVFQNFLIMPMTFLSGVFYSIGSLPPFWQAVSHLNPFFYMIDGFRYGFFGVSDLALAQPRRSSAVPGWSSAPLPFTSFASATRSAANPYDRRRTPSRSSKPDFACEHIALEGDGRHWYATIVSAEFDGLRAIQRHQRVYKTLGAKMHTDEVHALSMKTYTPAEWASAPPEPR